LLFQIKEEKIAFDSLIVDILCKYIEFSFLRNMSI